MFFNVVNSILMVVSFSFWSITIVWKLNSGGCFYTSHRLTSCKPCAKSGRLTHCQQTCQFEARAACCLESSVHSWRGQNGFTNGHNKDSFILSLMTRTTWMKEKIYLIFIYTSFLSSYIFTEKSLHPRQPMHTLIHDWVFKSKHKVSLMSP